MTLPLAESRLWQYGHHLGDILHGNTPLQIVGIGQPVRDAHKRILFFLDPAFPPAKGNVTGLLLAWDDEGWQMEYCVRTTPDAGWFEARFDVLLAKEAVVQFLKTGLLTPTVAAVSVCPRQSRQWAGNQYVRELELQSLEALLTNALPRCTVVGYMDLAGPESELPGPDNMPSLLVVDHQPRGIGPLLRVHFTRRNDFTGSDHRTDMGWLPADVRPYEAPHNEVLTSTYPDAVPQDVLYAYFDQWRQ